MKINNVQVYGIGDTARASGFPMQADIDEIGYSYPTVDGMSRLKRLSRAKPGSGHDCALKGIVVQADVTAPQYWWLQFGRYHFADIVSSQSKMHRLTEMDIDRQCNAYVDKSVIDLLKRLVKNYKEDECDIDLQERKFRRIVSNCPMGLMLTARITTNYLQLKTMYYQRKNHRLEEWHIFCEWVAKLPSFAELIGSAEQ